MKIFLAVPMINMDVIVLSLVVIIGFLLEIEQVISEGYRAALIQLPSQIRQHQHGTACCLVLFYAGLRNL